MTHIPTAKRGGIYKRLETDAEYLMRLVAAKHLTADTFFRGRMLDEVGDSHGMPRRIVDSAD